jgi:hypothetical protein
MTSPIDIPLDFSALSTLYCGRAYQLTCVKGIDNSSPATNLGNAVHKFLELRALGNTAGLLDINRGIVGTSQVDLGKLVMIASTLDTRIQFNGLLHDNEGVPLVEYKFSIPFRTVGDYRIVLCGTIDRLIYRDGRLIFTDYKTCAATGAAADRICREYITSFQLPFYLYVIHKYIHKFLPPQLAEAAVSLNMYGQYTMIYHSIIPAKVEDTAAVSISPSDIIYIEQLIDYAINKMLAIRSSQVLYPPEGTMYKMCPKCNHAAICSISDHDRMLAAINSAPTRQYDPTNFR